jgi:prefoldin subunit 5
MGDESKKPFDLGPILPMFGAGVDLGERLGDLAAGQKQLNARMDKLETRIDALDAKFEAKFDALDAKTDKMGHALHRLDERTKSMQNQIMVIGGAILAAVIAGIAVQLFSK